MARGERRKRSKVRLSKLYSFACGRKGFGEEHDRIGSPGFSRVVYVNESNSLEALTLNYPLNYTSTTKYTLFTFVPKSLFEQFRRVANFYFLLVGILAFTPLAPYTAISAILPLIVVIGASMIREGVEDVRRKQQDHEVNNRKVKVHTGNGNFMISDWKSLRVGDIVRVEKDEFFPSDLILLSSSYEDGIGYVETVNLDGETNLKLKQALDVTADLLQEDHNLMDFKAVVKCEDPNPNLYTFVGSMEINGENYPLSPQQVLLRDSKLRNTEFVYGAVIFTGHDTKVMQNATDPPSKRSTIEMRMDKIVYLLLTSLVLIATIGSVFFGIWTKEDLKNGVMKRWYLRPDDTTIYFNPKQAPVAAFFHFLTAMLLYNYFIPISLYISIEVVKTLQAMFINRDVQMYHEESDKPAQARTSNLNEELGQVDTILSDKTGTLTCNSMEFIKCSIAGVAYGRGVTEFEKAMARKNGSPIMNGGGEREENCVVEMKKPKIKGYNFDDPRVVEGNWVRERNMGVIERFFRLLAICHTCIPDLDEETGRVSYEAESPDEAAFVIAARELGFEFYNRTQTSITIREQDFGSGGFTERTYKLLNILEFSSARKRMSVIVKDEDGKILILCKGADSVMFERLARDSTDFEAATQEHINEYADTGLRTLVLAYREMEEREYEEFNKNFIEAKNSVSSDQNEIIEVAMNSVERDLILLGATAVEDKLQNGVPECIDKLAQAGIKIWVLTGDKMETAINIGFACSLLRQGMEQIIITLDSSDIVALEKNGDKDAVAKASKLRVVNQIEAAKKEIDNNSSGIGSFALIIDGKSLTYALDDDVKNKFLSLAIGCGSVICCRSSPKQKALVTRLVKSGTGKVTLGIGDGANDVGMLQEADIGVGISGAEGMQAVMASDIAIAQFRFLERLLLVHGHWCYRRLSSMICYFFYKNITFGVTLFVYEAYASFSGQPAYNDWYLSLYNVFFTSLPVVALGVFDQDVSARVCLKFPQLYQQGVKNVLFSWVRILGWMVNAVISAVLIFFLCTTVVQHQAFRVGGETAGWDILGAIMYTCVVWVVNCQMALSISYFTLIQHVLIWGSIALWYLFMYVYGSIPPSFYANSPYKILTERVGPAPMYWVVTLFVTATTLIPYFAYSAVQFRFFPMDHNRIQWLRHKGGPRDIEMVPQIATTVGVSSRRLEAKLSNHSIESERSAS